MSNELQQGGQKLYITITTKPLSIAIAERLPAIHATVPADVEGVELSELMTQARKRLEAPHGAD